MNFQGQLVGRKPLSPKLLGSVKKPTFSRGLRNTATTMQHLQAWCTPTISPNAEFIRMVGKVSEPFFDLLDQGTEDGSEQERSDENHLSQECHMV